MKIIKEEKEAKVCLQNEIVASGVREVNNLYKMQFKTITRNVNIVSKVVKNTMKDWHYRLGHVNVKTLNEMNDYYYYYY